MMVIKSKCFVNLVNLNIKNFAEITIFLLI